MFGTYKIYILVGLGIAYSMGLWHVASQYASSSWESEKLALVQKAIDNSNQNTQLAQEIGKQVDEKLSHIQVTQTTINRKVEREIVEKRVYADCVTPTTGVQLIEDAIRNKGESPSK